jgi:serine/threonine-protein kinase
MADFAAAWEAVEVPQSGTAESVGEYPGVQEMKDRLLPRLALSGALLNSGPLGAPATSINYGSAGIAHALYRMACATDDAQLLSLADVWSERAVREIPIPEAFYNRELGVTPQTVGETSLYHSPAGVYAVRAQIAQARGDVALLGDSIRKFIEASSRPCDRLDVTLGRAGTLLGCALLHGTASSRLGSAQSAGLLREFGQNTAWELWQTMATFAPIRESAELSNLGVAHGWAGLLYATLCWHQAAGESVPDWLGERLDQLGALAEPWNRGLRWKWDLKEPRSGYMPGWCNGSAGYVFLWTLAHRILGSPEYLALAEGAAWDACEMAGQLNNLCCGTAGHAYAMLNLYRHTGETCWLQRAQAACRHATAATASPQSRK